VLRAVAHLASESGGLVVVCNPLEVALHQGPGGELSGGEFVLDGVDGDLQDAPAPEVGGLAREGPVGALLVALVATAREAAEDKWRKTSAGYGNRALHLFPHLFLCCRYGGTLPRDVFYRM
jgi:hypothetical protein